MSDGSRWARLAAQVDPEFNPRPGLSAFNRAVVAAILAVVVIGVMEAEVHSSIPEKRSHHQTVGSNT